METNLLQKNILKKKIKGSIPLDNKTTLPLLRKKTPEYYSDYPELNNAARGLESPLQTRTIKGTKPVNDLNGAERSFGPERMKDPKFRSQLRKLQEKYKVTAYA